MKALYLIVLLLVFTGGSVMSKELSEAQQQELLDHIKYIRNQGPRPADLEGIDRIKCATGLAQDLFINRQYLTGKYAAEAEAFATRPNLQAFYDTPGGHFRIHYDTTGLKAVYQVYIDSTPTGGDGIPDYVNIVGRIADSVWAFEIDHLGFPPPASDADSGGGMALVDIYLNALSDLYYGVTWGETIIDAQTVTSFMELDNDYAGIPPYNGSTTLNGRLDAARVTIAHEFFHTIHYTMDRTEYEDQGVVSFAAYWWEMSAVWMEEMMYDNINDYYYYLDYFYDEPWKSLQAVPSYFDLHQYGAAVFPIFLSEAIDTAVIRVTWEKCRDYGTGTDFPLALNDAIDSITDGAQDLRSVFQEFAVWNYFPGTRASEAPSGYSFSEAANYSMIPDSNMLNFNDSVEYKTRLTPWVEDGDGWPDTLSNGDSIKLDGISILYYENHMPQNLAAHYINLRNIDFLVDTVDSNFDLAIRGAADYDYGAGWNLSLIQFPSDGFSQPVVTLYPTSATAFTTTTDYTVYDQVVAIPTPVSTNYHAYYYKRSGFGYALRFDTLGLTPPQEVAETHAVRPPYPNPFGTSPSDQLITFKTEIYSQQGYEVTMEIDIFNVAGEKIHEINSPTLTIPETFDNEWKSVTQDWDLTNMAGVRVVPGVYMALCRLIFADGTPEITEKYKIAVIR